MQHLFCHPSKAIKTIWASACEAPYWPLATWLMSNCLVALSVHLKCPSLNTPHPLSVQSLFMQAICCEERRSCDHKSTLFKMEFPYMKATITTTPPLL